MADNTVGRKIQNLSEKTELSVRVKVGNNNAMFAIQVDESTDSSKLLAHIRFIYEGKIVEPYLYCLEIPLTTRGEDIFNVLSDYLYGEK